MISSGLRASLASGAKWLGHAAAGGVLLTLGGTASAKTLNELASIQIVGNIPFDYQLSTARKLGLRRVRLAAYWRNVERPAGRYTWGPTDARISAVIRAGITPIVVLFGANDGYAVSDQERGAPPVDGKALDGFARFAAATAARYGAGRPDMRILYEIWNEPNTKTFWKRTPDPEGYARMAQAACVAIKASVPNASVLAFGMEGSPVKTPYRVPAYNLDIYREWANRAATPGLMACADGISFHPYLPSPEDVLAGEVRFQEFIARTWHRQQRPIIANTEWGYAIVPNRGVDASIQAALDLRALLIGTGLGRVTNLYQSVDGGKDYRKSDQTYGLVTADGTIKPAGLALRRLLKMIGDYEIEGVGHVAEQPNLYQFTARSNTLSAKIVWKGGRDSAKISVPLPLAAVATDLVSGQSVPQNGGKIMVGIRPVLILSQIAR